MTHNGTHTLTYTLTHTHTQMVARSPSNHCELEPAPPAYQVKFVGIKTTFVLSDTMRAPQPPGDSNSICVNILMLEHIRGNNDSSNFSIGVGFDDA